jgi:hypothetical protein
MHTMAGNARPTPYVGENRLKSIEYTDTFAVVHLTELVYDGNGSLGLINRYENSNLIELTRIDRDGALALQEGDGANQIVREYAWGQDRIRSAEFGGPAEFGGHPYLSFLNSDGVHGTLIKFTHLNKSLTDGS